jgi:sulfite exporter TauE/SafE
MTTDVSVLAISAAGIGLIHTLLGPDHYIPFIAMARAGDWSLRKTALITSLCGLGHVLGSVVLGSIGIILGLAVSSLEVIEAIRGDFAAWALIAFGSAYMLWGFRRAARTKPHKHSHNHATGESHSHAHMHFQTHAHVHGRPARFSPWALFVIFVLGPCEPLIPLLMYPAAKGSPIGLGIVVVVFALVTVATMLGVVLPSAYGMRLIRLDKMERFSHALAGASILLSGMGIKLLAL